MTLLAPPVARTGSQAPAPPPDEPPRTGTPDRGRRDVPRRLTATSTDDVAAVVGSLAGSLALVWLVFERLLAWSGSIAFLLSWYVVLLVLYATVTALGHPRTVVVDRLMRLAVTAAAGLVGLVLVSIVVYTFVEGWPALTHTNFYTQDMAGVSPTDPLTKGGILHAIVGTVIEISIAVAIALPLGLGAAVYMTEVGGGLARVVRTVVEAMTALPDILAGLFIYTTLIVTLGMSRTGFCAAMALTVMMIPTIARSAEVTLRVVPGGLREAGLALGASHWQSVRRVVLPTARAGLATALILGVARGIGETAPVLITSGASTFLNVNPFQDPMNSLPLFTFVSVRSGEPLFISRGFGAASVLLVLVIVLFAITRLLARAPRGAR